VEDEHVRAIEVTRQSSGDEPEATEVEPDAEEAGEWAPTDQASIRVNIGRLDEALERLADLINSRSKLSKAEAELKAAGADTRNLRFVIAENSRMLARLRAAITASRMVSLAELLQRLPLVVRGLTKDSEKSVNIDIQAGAAEVDKAVADRIFPAIVHLIRNAVDHAVETRAERRATGKPEIANLVVKCDDTSGTSLVITITDDGRGIDRDAVARKAGLSAARNNEELLQQICAAGLSTSDKVTRVSGRGMGMDIVRRSVEVLGGSLALSTEPGHGTSFTLVVPVSITIIDVMSFVSGDQTFVAPVSMIDEILEIDPANLAESPAVAGEGAKSVLLRRRSEVIPMLGLDALLDPKTVAKSPRKAIVVSRARGAVAFGIDRMIGKQEVVVRPLEDAWVQKAGIAGATDLGDGRPTLVLDLVNLGAVVMQNAAFTS
jgi:two-component system chemotaxis sensor kinase CheA